MPEVSADGLTYTFQLREGVKFNDGRPVTGEDVKGTFLRALDPEAAFQVFGTVYYDAIKGVPEYKEGKAKDIEGIAVDGNTVTFTLTREERRLPERPGARLRLHRAGRLAAPEDEPAAAR